MFNTTSLYLHIDIGTINLDIPSTLDLVLTSNTRQNPRRQDYGISSDGT